MGAKFESSAVAPVLPRNGVWAVSLGLVGLLLYTLRLIAFAVLSTLHPLVRSVLSLLAIGGFATCVLFKCAVHAPHFPLGVMLLFSVAMAVLSVVYSLLVSRLAP
jgi:hypothetical protein